LLIFSRIPLNKNNVETIILNGVDLTLDQVVLIARGSHDGSGHHYPLVKLSDSSVKTLKEFRQALEVRIAAKDIIYGVNTGCGSKKGVIIPPSDIIAYQARYIPAHCVATGVPLPEEVVRLAMVLRVNSFAKGNSGIRLATCQQILDFYNARAIPVIPSQGSVGSSGDLCLLAHMAAALIGRKEQLVTLGREIMTAPEALGEMNLEPLVLEAKEAMGITNGSTFTLAMCLLAVYDAERLLRYSNQAFALSFEAIRGEKAALDLRIHKARNHQGAVRIAEEVLALTHGSKRTTDKARAIKLPDETHKKYHEGVPTPRVQDAYSFRAYATVAGSSLETIEFAKDIFIREINASTDNPLLFKKDDGTFETLSGGNFHGEPLAQAADYLKIALQSIAGISDRRFYALLSSAFSYGLPDDLAGSELDTGLMILQYTTASLVSQNKVLCYPSAVDSIPTSAGQEDYVSMGTISALNLRQVLENTFTVIAAELMAGARGINFTESHFPNGLGAGSRSIFRLVNSIVPFEKDDCFWSLHLENMKNALKSNSL